MLTEILIIKCTESLIVVLVYLILSSLFIFNQKPLVHGTIILQRAHDICLVKTNLNLL